MKELVYSIIPRPIFAVIGVLCFYGALFAISMAGVLAFIHLAMY